MTRTRKTLLLSMGRTTNMALIVGLGAALSRMLPRASYGAFQQVMVVYLLSSTALVVGLPQSVFYFLPRYEGARRRTFMTLTLLGLAVVGGALTAGLYFGAYRVGAFLHSPLLPDMLRAWAPYLLFMLPFGALEATMMSLDRPGVAVGLGVLARSGALGAVVIPLALGADVPTAMRWWVRFAAVLSVAASVLMLRAVGGIGWTGWWSILKAQVRYATPVAAAMALGCVAAYADKIIVSRAFGPEVYAGYANGARELPLVGIVSGSIITVLWPEMVALARGRKTGELLALWHLAIRRCAAVLMPFLGLGVFLAPEVMVVLFSRRYADSAGYFRVYLWSLPVRVVLYGPLAMSFRANWVFTRGQGIAAVLAVGLGAAAAWWTRRPVLVAAAVVLGLYAEFAYAAVRLSPLLGVRARRFLPLGHWLGTLGVALGCGLVSWAATLPLAGESFLACLVRLAAGSTVFAVLYALAASRLGLVRWGEVFRSLRSGAAAAPPGSTVHDEALLSAGGSREEA